jgi:hypothetical protein
VHERRALRYRDQLGGIERDDAAAGSGTGPESAKHLEFTVGAGNDRAHHSILPFATITAGWSTG